MSIKLLPKSNSGKWSVGLVLAFFIFLSIFFLFVELGYRGGETFFGNPVLAIPILIAAISGIGSFMVGLMSIIRSKEYSVLVFIASVIGLFVLIFVLGEILTPH
ncbi:hypothetical protein ACFL2C_00665 [Patescibacteria group bacterium]